MALKKFNFNVNYTENYSRVGVIETGRGNINTPAFMPVGTQATVKGTFIDDIIKTGSEIILLQHGSTNKALIVTKIQIGLGTIFGDKYFAVLERTHGTRIHVDIGIEL